MTATTVKLISCVGFTPASPDHVREGLLGYVTCTFADMLLLDGLTLRVTETGRHSLGFPRRIDKGRREHAYFRPQDPRARTIIENAIFDVLRIKREART